MQSLGDKTVGEIVTEDYRRASVLKRYDIDFCCGGDQTLEAACRSRGLDLEKVQRQITNVDDRFADDLVRPELWPLDFLADYIERVHHAFIREQVPVLIQFSRKVAGVHGHQDEALYEVDALIQQLASTLMHHIQQEEEMLFPQFRLYETGVPDQGWGAELVHHLIDGYVDQHAQIGTMMRRIRELTRDFQPPLHACNTYRALYAGLHLFEKDMRWHVHLENNVLFPRAAEIGNQLQPDEASMPAS